MQAGIIARSEIGAPGSTLGTILAACGFLGGPRMDLLPSWVRGACPSPLGRQERIFPVRHSILTAALLAALGGTLALPASAAPLAPAAVAAPADMVSTVQMDRMERHMMRRRMERHAERRMMRHRMERHMMRREMRHRMMHRM